MTGQHEIVICGGGPVGASAALGLARLGRDVAVIEPVARHANHQPSYDDRTLALNAVSLNILCGLGVLDPDRCGCPIRHIRITRAGGFGHLALDACEYGLDAFGRVVVARELGNRLIEALAAEPNITQYCPDALEDFTVHERRVDIRLRSGRQLQAGLLVGADGTDSAVRSGAGIAANGHDYRQTAMIFNVRPTIARPYTAFERFGEHGPLALLPQPEERCGVVWVDHSERIEQALGWSDEELVAHLSRRAGTGFGGFQAPGRRAHYPLRLLAAERITAQRLVLIGNAAHTMHPVSAQGFNLGLRDAAALIDAMREAADPGDASALQDFAEARRQDQHDTVRYTDTLARAFSNPSRLVRAGAAAGLAAHALLPSLKRRLVYAAMGYRTPVSSLARRPSG